MVPLRPRAGLGRRTIRYNNAHEGIGVPGPVTPLWPRGISRDGVPIPASRPVRATLWGIPHESPIVIGGPTSRARPRFLSRLEREVRGRALTIPGRHVTLSLSHLGSTAGAIGGAILVLRQTSRLVFRGRPTRLVYPLSISARDGIPTVAEQAAQ